MVVVPRLFFFFFTQKNIKQITKLWEAFHQDNQVVNQSWAPKLVYTKHKYIPDTQETLIIISLQAFASTATSLFQKMFYTGRRK